MQNLSSMKLLPVVTRLAILLLVAKIIALGVWWYLPSDGVELNAKKSYQAKYHRIDFKNMLEKAKVVAQAKEQTTAVGSAFSINSLLLKGLYGSRFNGFAIVAKKVLPRDTTIVSVGEVYAGYKLKEIALRKVLFTKGGKEYELALPQITQKGSVHSVRRVHNSSSSDDDSDKTVTRQDIKYYSSNPSRIWKDIAIAPVRRAGRIVGFKVNRIKPGSKMATLGLKKGDIMIRANNIKLTSFNDAINLYKKIDTIDTIAIVVLRNNQEKEIIYEIH